MSEYMQIAIIAFAENEHYFEYEMLLRHDLIDLISKLKYQTLCFYFRKNYVCDKKINKG